MPAGARLVAPLALALAVATSAGFAEVAQGFQQTATDGRRDAAVKRFVPVAQGTMDLGNWFVMSACKPGGAA